MGNIQNYDLAVFIGRFQPVHLGHVATMRLALGMAHRLAIVLGGHRNSRRARSPWSTEERTHLIRLSLTRSERARVFFLPVRDRLWDDTLWQSNVLQGIKQAFPLAKRIVLVGHNKDASSYYLKIFPTWDFVETGSFGALNATDFREQYFCPTAHTSYKGVGPRVARWLSDYKKTKAYQFMVGAFKATKQECNLEKNSQIAQIPQCYFILIWGAYLLLVNKAQHPGLGQLAIPSCPWDNLQEDNLAKVKILDYLNFLKFPLRALDGKELPSPSPWKGGFFFRLHEKSSLCPDLGAHSCAQWILCDELSFLEESFFEDHYRRLKFLLENSIL